jgi:hypothetical protein
MNAKTSTCIVLGIFMALTLFVVAQDELAAKRHTSTKLSKQHYVTSDGNLIDNLYLLRDLDNGDLESVRRRLNENSMYCILGILESANFSTNSETLFKHPGLRAASKFWATNTLPEIPIPDHSLRTEMSNRIHTSLVIDWSELERQRLQRNQDNK